MKKKTATELGETIINEMECKGLKPNSHKERNSRARRILLSTNSVEIMQLDEIETIMVAVRNEMLKLDRCRKTKMNYIYCGFGTVLSWFHDNNCHTFSKSLLEKLVDVLHNDYV